MALAAGFSARRRRSSASSAGFVAEDAQVGILLGEFVQLVVGVEIVDRLLVAFAHLDEMPRQFVRARVALGEVVAEIAAVPRDGAGELVERVEHLENFDQRAVGDDLVVGKILQLHVVAAELDQHLVELRFALDIFLALLALDLEERRLRDVDEALADQLGHLAEEERQQQRADVRAVDVRIGHDDDLVVASAARG